MEREFLLLIERQKYEEAYVFGLKIKEDLIVHLEKEEQ